MTLLSLLPALLSSLVQTQIGAEVLLPSVEISGDQDPEIMPTIYLPNEETTDVMIQRTLDSCRISFRFFVEQPELKVPLRLLLKRLLNTVASQASAPPLRRELNESADSSDAVETPESGSLVNVKRCTRPPRITAQSAYITPDAGSAPTIDNPPTSQLIQYSSRILASRVHTGPTQRRPSFGPSSSHSYVPTLVQPEVGRMEIDQHVAYFNVLEEILTSPSPETDTWCRRRRLIRKKPLDGFDLTLIITAAEVSTATVATVCSDVVRILWEIDTGVCKIAKASYFECAAAGSAFYERCCKELDESGSA